MIYLNRGQDNEGPYSQGQLRSMWKAGSVTSDTLFWEDGSTEWLPLSVMEDELDSPPPASNAVSHRPAPAAVAESANPPGFRLVFYLNLLLPILGILFGIMWLCHPKQRGAGASMIVISVIVMFVWSIWLHR